MCRPASPSRSIGARRGDSPRAGLVIAGALATACLLAACGGRDGAPAAIDEDDSLPRLVDEPDTLRATEISSGAVALAWQLPDTAAIDGVEVLRGGVPIGVSRTGRFLDEGVGAGSQDYAVRGRRLDAIAGIDLTTDAVSATVTVPSAPALAVLNGGAPVRPDLELSGAPTLAVDPSGRLVATGQQGDLFAVQRVLDGASGPTRFLPGLDAPELFAGTDVWFVLGDDGEARPLLALDPDTLETRWQLETTALTLTGGCRFAELLADGALSCRGFADDTLRIGADGLAGPTAPSVRVPTGDRRSADDGSLLVDVWTLPAGAAGNRLFPVHEWVLRDIEAGTSTDLGAWLADDPSLDFPHTVRAVGVVDGTIVFAGDVLAHGCLRVCVEELAIPLYVDAHFVARIDRPAGRIAALERLPLGRSLGDGVVREEAGALLFLATDRLIRVDPGTLATLDTTALGGEPVGIGAGIALTRTLDDDGPVWYRFVR